MSVLAALTLTLVWAGTVAADMTGSALELQPVLGSTLFGHLVLLRLGLLILAGAALLTRPLAAALPAGLAVATQAGHGHALAMQEGPSLLLLSEILHVLAAGAWIGGLLPLALFVASAPPERAALASRRFGRLGVACVLILAGTALLQGWTLAGGFAGLVGTGYGLLLLAKLLLFLVLLGFAARNRFRLTPAVASGGSGRALARSIAGETAVGLLVVLVAGLLTSVAPGMHLQPVWPFAWQPSFEAVSEEPEFLREVLVAGGAMLAAVMLAGVALWRHWRLRWALTLAAAFALWIGAPHLNLLLGSAVPTQFWSSPTGFASASVAAGAALYPSHCAACHGAEGRGDGPAAGSLPVPPADLTAQHLWAHPDGEMFWWLTHGIEGPEGSLVMPGFAGVLDPTQRWALIDWARANNAGQAYRATGAWPLPVRAPGLALACDDRTPASLSDLHGRVVRVVFGGAEPVPGVVTVMVDRQASPGPGLCASPDPNAARAYAVVTGLSPLDGAEILIDGDGWLRTVLTRPSPERRAAALATIQAQPLATAPVGHAGMRM